MTLKTRGQNISKVEVSHIDIHGFWLCIKNKEYFLPYADYPWFKEAKVKEIINVNLLHEYHLFWPDLDVDLEINSLENPQNYPLKYK